MLVSKETLSIAESKGYDLPSVRQDAVIKWLQIAFDCYVIVTPEFYKTGINWNVQVFFYNPNEESCLDARTSGKYGDNGEFQTYEKALEFGIQIALKRI